MYTGTKTIGVRDERRKLRRVIASMPVRGCSMRPVRERPPSTKYSTGKPLVNSVCRYSLNTAVYSGLPLKVRRMKNAPPRRSRPPMSGMLRLMPAATCGGVRPLRNSR
ncbi:hypothetical protein D3C76_1627950 [compost metagenome]